MSSGFERLTTVIRLQRRRRGGRSARTSPTTATTSAPSRSTARELPLAGEWTFDELLRAPRRARPVPRRRAELRRLPQLPPLGVRERGARPRAAPGRPLARRRRSAASRAGARSSSPRAWASRRRSTPVTRRLAALPGPALQARRHARLGRRADRRPDRDRRRRLDRLQGRLQGHAGRRRRPTRPSTAGSPRRSRTPGSRTPTSTTEDAREALRPFEDRITWDAPIHSVDDILAMPVLPRTVNLKPSRFGSVRGAVRRATTSAPSAAWAPTAAASSSSASAAGRSSTWRRSSTPTRRTTSRRRV